MNHFAVLTRYELKKLFQKKKFLSKNVKSKLLSVLLNLNVDQVK